MSLSAIESIASQLASGGIFPVIFILVLMLAGLCYAIKSLSSEKQELIKTLKDRDDKLIAFLERDLEAKLKISEAIHKVRELIVTLQSRNHG